MPGVLVAMPFATSSFLLLVAFLLLVVRPGAPSSVLAPSSDALCYHSCLHYCIDQVVDAGLPVFKSFVRTRLA